MKKMFLSLLIWVPSITLVQAQVMEHDTQFSNADSSLSITRSTSDQNNCLFNWAEDNYPSLFLPSRSTIQTFGGYTLRYYSHTNTYLGISNSNSHLYYYAPTASNNALLDLGPATTWQQQAGCNTVGGSAPIANAGLNQNVATGTNVSLNGSSSNDAENDELTYLWTLTSKPTSSAAVLSAATSMSPSFTADMAGTYVATLVVNDGNVSSNPATVTITAANAGILTTKIGRESYIRGIALQPDGKIIVAGVSAVDSSRSDFALARYNTNGSLDTSFSGDGIVTTNIAKRISSTDWVRGVAIQPDGKIVAVGYSVTYGSDAYAVAIVRYNPNGSLDTSFSSDGIVTTEDSSRNLFGHSVLLQTDGKIVVAGSANLSNRYTAGYGTLLMRYNSDGSIDTSFAYNGILIDTSTKGVGGAALQSDGKILVTGANDNGNYLSSSLALARYNSNGSLDTSFSGSGIVNTEIGSEVGSSNSGSSIALQADGKILVAGAAQSGYGSSDFSLVRYDSSGSIDYSFSGDGIVTTDFSAEADYAYSVTVQADGKILVVGQSTYARADTEPFPGLYSGGNTDFALVRYNNDGSIDAGFANDGKLTTDFNKLVDTAYSIAVQTDGRILVAGSSFLHVPEDTSGGRTDFAVARYTSNGILDIAFNNN